MKVRLQVEKGAPHQIPATSVFFQKDDDSPEVQLGSYVVKSDRDATTFLRGQGMSAWNQGQMQNTNIFAALLTAGPAAIKDKEALGILYLTSALMNLQSLIDNKNMYFANEEILELTLEVSCTDYFRPLLDETKRAAVDRAKKQVGDIPGFTSSTPTPEKGLNINWVTGKLREIRDVLNDVQADPDIKGIQYSESIGIDKLKENLDKAIDSMAKAGLIFEGKFAEVTAMVEPRLR